MSKINTTSLNEAFPVAGQDNSSQGFRDNFQNIKNNFKTAYEEITYLENNSVFTNQPNDLTNTIFSNVSLNNENYVINFIEPDLNQLEYDCSISSSQILVLNTSTDGFSFINVPELTSREQKFKLTINVVDSTKTFNFGDSNFLNLDKIANVNGTVLKFSKTGIYTFEFCTFDNGDTWIINDLSRNYRVHEGNLVFTNSNVDIVKIYSDNQNNGVIVANIIYANTYVGVESNAQYITGTVTADGGFNTSGNISGNNVNGTISSSSQPNITSLGDLEYLNVEGNVRLNTNDQDSNVSPNHSTVIYGMFDICGPMMTSLRKIEITGNGQLKTVNSTDNTIIFAPNPNVDNFSNISIEMPSGADDGQRFTFIFSNTVSNIQWATSGNTWVSAEDTFGPTKGITLIAYEGFFYSA